MFSHAQNLKHPYVKIQVVQDNARKQDEFQNCAKRIKKPQELF